MDLTRKLVIKIVKHERFKIKINTKPENIDFSVVTSSNYLSAVLQSCNIKTLLSLINESLSIQKFNNEIFRKGSSHRMCSVGKGVFRNFAKFTRKHIKTCNFIKNKTMAQVFSSEFCKTSMNTPSTKHLRATASN